MTPIEVFLPFEMEVTYGAALHLMIANTLFPHSTDSTPGYSWSQEAHSILDEMVSKGNMLAAARKTELSHLESLFNELAARIERAGLQALTLATPEGYMNGGAGAGAVGATAENVNVDVDVHGNVMAGAGDIHPVDAAQGHIHAHGHGRHQQQQQLQHPLPPPHMHDPTGVIDPALGMDAHTHANAHAHAHAHVHGPYGDLHSSPSSSLPHLANSAELLSEIGISSYEFLSIIEQIGGSESSSVLDPSPSWKG